MRIEAKIFVAMAVFGLLLITADVAVAQSLPPIEDSFFVQVDAAGEVIADTSGGSGYDGNGDGAGDWYYYPNTNWWNEWFYDHPFDPTRWKKIDIAFRIAPLDPLESSWAEVTYNWSTPGYPPNPGQPPLPPLTLADEAEWIMRADPSIFVGELLGDPICIIDSIIIPDYNPEWISVDIRGYNFEIIDGCIIHECIPEPATMALLALGGIGVLLRRRRR